MAELAESLTVTEADRLTQAEALVRAYCGWHIAPSRTVEDAVIRGSGTATILLPSLYVTAVAAINDNDTDLTVEDDYTWSAAGVVTRVGYWSTDEVVVSYTHGYEEPPAEVTAVVQAIAQRAVNNPGGQASSRSIGPFAESYGSLATGTALSLLDSEMEVLRRYRIPVVA